MASGPILGDLRPPGENSVCAVLSFVKEPLSDPTASCFEAILIQITGFGGLGHPMNSRVPLERPAQSRLHGGCSWGSNPIPPPSAPLWGSRRAWQWEGPGWVFSGQAAPQRALWQNLIPKGLSPPPEARGQFGGKFPKKGSSPLAATPVWCSVSDPGKPRGEAEGHVTAIVSPGASGRTPDTPEWALGA